MAWLPWQRPGFDLGLALARTIEERPGIKGIILGQHGLINWADDDKACYELSLRLIEQAARAIEERDKGAKTFGGLRFEPIHEERRDAVLADVLPTLRGMVSQQKRFIGTVQSDGPVARFVNSVDAPRLAELGTSCPDHFLRTKIKPMYVDWDPQGESTEALVEKIRAGLERYRADYAAYYEACKHDDSPAMRDPNPTVILIPGLGMIAWGKSKSESRVTAEFYNAAVEVMRGAEALDAYISLPQQEAFDIEYWALEEAKLQRMPPEKELARRVVVVIGAGSGIGKATALRVAREGAHVVAADMHEDAARETADELTSKLGQGIGVAGTGISGCGPAVGLGVDITRRESVREAARQGGTGVRRDRQRHRHGGRVRAAGSGRPGGRRQVGSDVRRQRDRQLHRGRRGAPHVGEAGSARHLGADDERQRHRAQGWARSPTTPARQRPTIWCASSPSSWRPSCGSTVWRRRRWCTAAACSRVSV